MYPRVREENASDEIASSGMQVEVVSAGREGGGKGARGERGGERTGQQPTGFEQAVGAETGKDGPEVVGRRPRAGCVTVAWRRASGEEMG